MAQLSPRPYIADQSRILISNGRGLLQTPSRDFNFCPIIFPHNYTLHSDAVSEDGHGHVMCGLITFHSTVNGEMYGESGSF